VTAPTATDPGVMGRDFSGTLTQFVIGFLRGRTPEGTLEEIFGLAGETRSARELCDVNAWSSYRQYRNLLEATGKVLGGGPEALTAVGLHTLDTIRNPELMETLRALGSPATAYEAFAGGINSFAPAASATIQAIAPNEFRIEYRMKPPNEPFREHCLFQFGMLATIPQIFGYPPAEILDPVCECDGTPACSARLHWEVAEPRVVELAHAKLQATLYEARLDELQRTVGELVSGDGLDLVLARVVGAARRAVQAPSFVLDVRPGGAFDRFVHADGIDEAEAARLTADLRGNPGRRPVSNVLACKVASERTNYGYLVAVRPGNGSFELRERSVLDSYARLAASALDSEAAITDARRQAEAAEALLALSSSLADLATNEETVARLARAVPSVIDCDRVVVSLIDPASQIARVQATYGFDAATDVALRSLEIPMSPRVNLGLYRHPPISEAPGFDATLLGAGLLGACSYAIGSNTELFGWITVAVVEHSERLDDDRGIITDRLRGLAGQAAIAIRNARLVDEIRHQALHDHLTGLPNRALIVDRVGQAIARARREHSDVALLFVDLDGFKDVNDTLGHGAGDQLLQAVAARFAGSLRESDTVARLGGDEFVVLAEGLSLAAGPELVAERLLQVLAEPFLLGADQVKVSVTASIGIATGLRDTPEELFTDADTAVYAAKHAGKGRYVLFQSHMGDTRRSRHELETDLQAAVVTDDFFLVYQPIFDLAGLAIVGVEALLRWNHPTRGVLEPDEFVPALEASGQIVSVGRWVLQEACRQAALWQTRGRTTGMSVNVSSRQLDAACLISDVRSALTQAGLPPETLTIEITETCLMRDSKSAFGQLHRLKQLGVRIAIDDFGTGYSSLAYLRQFPVDCLKIDKSFIAAMANSPEAEALIHTLIRLGKALNLETVAEGIERTGQLVQLQTENCEAGQGYLFARPLPPDQIERLLTADHVGGRGLRD
jgi:diguanylate cyclase (GGDEF)-like protein